MSKYIDRVLEECRQKNAGEPEFLQTIPSMRRHPFWSG